MTRIDTLIIGHGLAGATLAWELIGRGADVRVVDDADPGGASRVAAGLLAPVGGKRLGVAWRAGEAWPAAVEFYRRLGDRLGVALLDERPIVRLFTTEEQRREFERRRAGPLARWVAAGEPGVSPDLYRLPLGGFQAVGARLDVLAFLGASRVELGRRGLLIEGRIDVRRDLRVAADCVAVERLGLAARDVTLCRGFAERASGVLPFEPAKGELLTVHAPALTEQRVVQRGVWVAPAGRGRFHIGATFERDPPDAGPTGDGRRRLERELLSMLRLPYEVVDHRAGVRPIVATRRPIAGPLPGLQRVCVLNGLGANGALWAPWAAAQLAAWLVHGTAIDHEIDAAQRL